MRAVRTTTLMMQLARCGVLQPIWQKKFCEYYHAGANKIFCSLKEQTKEEFDKPVINPPRWVTRPCTKAEKEQVRRVGSA